MDLTSDDRHNMQLDPKFIPKPAVNNRLSSAFHLPIGTNIAYDTNSVMPLVPYLTVLFSFSQVLDGEKLLLILIDKVRVAIYLERISAMGVAIGRRRPVKILNREKLEQ